MEINNALSAASSGDALKQAVGIALLSKVKDTQTAQAVTLLQDFAAAQHPYLGKTLDIKI
ncbi:YjfB family protein [Paenibacillus piri]|uniref:Putative motility protein n=1 Tax=Paenibacillus piri TaxID=2547395 RepID=A0A4R5KL02_9BACL|nr:YjfB family protein [Paenibacillus piri]TDF96239.1 putative motility protein [Paenibacillus piri]